MTTMLKGLPDNIIRSLNEGGYETVQDVNLAFDSKLSALKGVGSATVKKIRAATGRSLERSPPSRQAEMLGLPFESITVVKSKSGKGWFLPQCGSFAPPEHIVLDRYRADGWSGVACEGDQILNTLKAACLDFLIEVNTFGDPDDACGRYLEAQCTIHKAQASQIVASVVAATEDTIRKNFTRINENQFIQANHPRMDIEVAVGLWRTLGEARLKGIISKFLEDPYSYRAGWPDLTLIRGEELAFVEVKTSDRMRLSQLSIVQEFVIPIGLPFRVVQLRPDRISAYGRS